MILNTLMRAQIKSENLYHKWVMRWIPRFTASMCQNEVSRSSTFNEVSTMNNHTIIGIDLAKTVFQVGIMKNGKITSNNKEPEKTGSGLQLACI
jgi:hypothetical protein